MNLQNTLSKKVKQAISQLYNTSLETVEFQATRKEFDGDITIVVFPMLRLVKGNPIEIGNAIGTYLVESISEIKSYNVVKGFLNLVLSDAYFLNFFNEVSDFSKFLLQNIQVVYFERALDVMVYFYLAWKTYGKGETPKTTGLKGDKLVGNYYVKFDQEYKKEVLQLMAEGLT